MAMLIDEAMSTYGIPDWVYNELPVAVGTTRDAQSISMPLTVEAFVAGSLRKLETCARTRLVVDIMEKVPEFGGLANLCGLINAKNYDGLPEAVKPARPLADGDKLGLVVQHHGDGLMTIIKFIYFAKQARRTHANGYVKGVAYTPAFREGPWAWRKGFQSIIDRLPGCHVDWAALTPKIKVERGPTAKWEVDDDELDAGIHFINTQAPDDNDKNQQWLFVEKNIKQSSGSPIAGWPASKVQIAVSNKAKGSVAAAAVNDWFPLCIFDLNPVWTDVLLPMVFPMLKEYGILFFGLPGVGKTPTFITLAMAMGRYWARTMTGDMKPGWRRGKQMDNFRGRKGSLCEAVFLDDPGLSGIKIEDIKSFLDVGEDGTANARYNPVSLIKNQMRGIADNESIDDSEPGPSESHVLESVEGLKLCMKPFEGWQKAHVMAVLKRAVCCIAGRHGLYVRFPNKSEEAPVYRITSNHIVKDWLRDREHCGSDNKVCYNAYKQGKQMFYEGFEQQLDLEQEFVDKAMDYRNNFRHDEYIAECNERLSAILREQFHPPPIVHVVPATPEDEDSQETGVLHVHPDGSGSYQIPTSRAALPRSTKRQRFGHNFEVRKGRRIEITRPSQSAPSHCNAERDAAIAESVFAVDEIGEHYYHQPDDEPDCEDHNPMGHSFGIDEE